MGVGVFLKLEHDALGDGEPLGEAREHEVVVGTGARRAAPAGGGRGVAGWAHCRVQRGVQVPEGAQVVVAVGGELGCGDVAEGVLAYQGAGQDLVGAGRGEEGQGDPGAGGGGAQFGQVGHGLPHVGWLPAAVKGL